MRDRTAASSSSSTTAKLAEAGSKEFFWGCELTKAKPEIQWTFTEEDDDQDFLQHTLFLRHAVLGAGVPEDERQVVEIETVNFAGDTVKQPLVSMTAGKMDMCQLDLNFGHEIPVHFRLVEGSGPVFLSAQQLVEFPQEVDEDYTETEYTEDEEEEDLEALEEDEEKAADAKACDDDAKVKKRKRGKLDLAKKKRGKMDSEANGASEEDESMEEETEGTEEDASDEDASEEESEVEESDEDTPKKKGKKPTKADKAKATKKAVKAVKAMPPKKGAAKKAKAK